MCILKQSKVLKKINCIYNSIKQTIKHRKLQSKTVLYSELAKSTSENFESKNIIFKKRFCIKLTKMHRRTLH